MRLRGNILLHLREIVYYTIYGIVKYIPSPIGDVLRLCVLKIFMARIRSWWIREGATFLIPQRIRIGKGCSVNEWVFMDGAGGIEIGDNVRIAHGCSFVSEDHGFSDPDAAMAGQEHSYAKITIESDVWIGCGVRVLKGVTIGSGSVVGAGAVVTRSIPPNSIAAGIPAKVIRNRAKSQPNGPSAE